MKTWMLLGGWLLVGLVVGLRGRRAPWERVLAVAFWPFFMVVPAGSPTTSDPVGRLRVALAAEDPAQVVVGRLAQALDRQRVRLARLEQAVAGAGPEGGEEEALAAARQRSRDLLVAARDRERAALGAAEAAVEEAATRLWLLRERGEPAEIDALLRGLVARIDADMEVEGSGVEGSGVEGSRVEGSSVRGGGVGGGGGGGGGVEGGGVG